MAKVKQKEAPKEQPQTLDELLSSKGFEGATSSSYAMPFLRILQKLSPELDKDDAKYIKGAEAGDIVHTVSKEVFSEVNIVPLQYRETYIEWIPRVKGGGFVTELEFPSPQATDLLRTCSKEDNKTILPNGNEFKRHANYFCALEGEEGEWEPVVISMSASQLKTSRVWLSTLAKMKIEHEGKTFPARNIRSYQWTLGTERLQNDQGTWYGWTYKAGDNTLYLPQLGDIQDSVRQAITSNLLTYDRSEQAQGASEAENAL